jgi:hypothetical protein
VKLAFAQTMSLRFALQLSHNTAGHPPTRWFFLGSTVISERLHIGGQAFGPNTAETVRRKWARYSTYLSVTGLIKHLLISQNLLLGACSNFYSLHLILSPRDIVAV